MQAAKRHAKDFGRTQLHQQRVHAKCIWGLGLACTLAGVAGAQAQPSQPEFSVAGDKIGTGNAPDAAAAALAGELTASKVIADPGAPYENVFQNFNVGLGTTPKFGAGRFYFKTGPLLLGTSALTPVSRGFQPETAELKVGNFYLDIDYLSGTLLYTDNENLSGTNREGDLASAVTLGITALYQITEGLRVGVSGALIWLPLDGKFGVSGFGLTDPYARFALDGQALFQAGFSYDFTLGRWDVRLFDDFQVNNRSVYGLGEDGFIDLYDGESFDEENGFRKERLYDVPNGAGRAPSQPVNTNNRFDADNTDVINTAGVIATRMLPTDTRASLGYFHQNFWDLSSNAFGNRNARYLDTFQARLDSERENLRFKPYSYYTASKNDQQSSWDQVVGGGIRGPITENMFFDGGAGYLFSGNTDNTELLWHVRVEHAINPTTSHAIQYSRNLVQPDRFLSEILQYQITKVLGPYLQFSAYAQREETEDLDNSNSLAVINQAGALLSYDLAEHGALQFLGFYRDYNFNNGVAADYSVWTARAIYSRQIGETVVGEIMYQYEQRDSTAAGESYYENLVALRLTKFF